MGKEARGDIVRVNMYMSKALRDFYKDYADEMGTTMSSVMIMALKQYMDSQKALKMGNELKAIVMAMNQGNILAEPQQK